jgi:hypothetical protein
MLSEKDFWNSLPDNLRKSLETILDRYQRHLMVLEAEVAELKNALFELRSRLDERSHAPWRPPSATRPCEARQAAVSEFNNAEFEK